MKINTHKLQLPLILTSLMVFGLVSCKEAGKPEVSMAAEGSVNNLAIPEHTMEDLTARGEYLVGIIGCADCHTPKKMTEKGPVPDMDRYMMGYDASRPLPPVPEQVPLGPWVLLTGDLTAAVGPWGTSYAGNLTPHETGIGNWTLDQFRKALREGKYKGIDQSRPLMPPMPVEAYRNLTDEDLEAIFRYLNTLDPIENIVPGYQPPAGM